LLELALRDSDLDIRLDAVEALRTIGGDRAARGLTAAVHDRSRRLRLRAVDALGAIGGPTARQLLDYVQAVDRDRTVRTVAVQELANLRAGH
jgi:HEAT repeat protein